MTWRGGVTHARKYEWKIRGRGRKKNL